MVSVASDPFALKSAPASAVSLSGAVLSVGTSRQQLLPAGSDSLETDATLPASSPMGLGSEVTGDVVLVFVRMVIDERGCLCDSAIPTNNQIPEDRVAELEHARDFMIVA